MRMLIAVTACGLRYAPTGDGWEKHWPLDLRITQAVQMAAVISSPAATAPQQPGMRVLSVSSLAL
jgi:hypothetical protein